MTGDLDRLFDTADSWREEALALRRILLDTGLTEEMKWRKPCYTHGGTNIVILQRMKDFLALLFFKGALLKDPGGLLAPQGPNSRLGYRACFTAVEEILEAEDRIRALIGEAIAVEKAGLKPAAAPEPEWCTELREKLDEDPAFREAFEALTPGRRKGYNLHFAGAKQSATRAGRIEKYTDRIFAGKGLHDR